MKVKYLEEREPFSNSPKGAVWASSGPGCKSPKGWWEEQGLPCTVELPRRRLTGGNKGIPGHRQVRSVLGRPNSDGACGRCRLNKYVTATLFWMYPPSVCGVKHLCSWFSLPEGDSLSQSLGPSRSQWRMTPWYLTWAPSLGSYMTQARASLGANHIQWLWNLESNHSPWISQFSFSDQQHSRVSLTAMKVKSGHSPLKNISEG